MNPSWCLIQKCPPQKKTIHHFNIHSKISQVWKWLSPIFSSARTLSAAHVYTTDDKLWRLAGSHFPNYRNTAMLVRAVFGHAWPAVAAVCGHAWRVHKDCMACSRYAGRHRALPTVQSLYCNCHYLHVLSGDYKLLGEQTEWYTRPDDLLE